MPGEGAGTASSTIRLKRAYESPETDDGVRVLVDRLWARGVSKEAAHLDAWMKELGPSTELRQWFGHRPDRWDGFVEQYRRELETPLRQLLLAELDGIAAGSTLTLVYGAHDDGENEAVVLRHYLLHQRPSAGDSWEAGDTLLITAAALAAAHHDAAAPSSDLTRFAASILTVQEIDGALQSLLSSGALRPFSDGWQVTPRGLRRVRGLSSTGPDSTRKRHD